MRKFLPIVVFIALPMLVPTNACGDGRFYSSLEVASEPGIEAQRAVVAFRDGVETLIVESDVRGEGESYGWILPLPAEPSSIEPGEPYALDALDAIVQPDVAAYENYPHAMVVITFVLMVFVVFLCRDHLCLKKGRSFVWAAVRMVLLVFGFFILIATLLPTMMRRGEVSHSPIAILQTARVGVYDVVVIKGQRAEDVEAWLTSNGFSCPESTMPVIRDYIADGWCFMAATVSAGAGDGEAGASAGSDAVLDGSLTHHPLAITFEVAEAVYPMRLTGVDAEPIQLDLFVIADDEAAAENMKTWVCSDKYRRYRAGRDYDSLFVMPLTYRGDRWYGSRIGVPCVSKVMWPKCVITRLHGKFKAADMERDIGLTWLPPEPRKAMLHSRGSALGCGVGIVFLGVCALSILFTAVASRKGWSWAELKQRRRWHVVVPALLAGVVCYVWLDPMPTRASHDVYDYWFDPVGRHWRALESLSELPPDIAFPQAYGELLKRYSRDEGSEQASCLEAPGDYMIDATSNGWELSILDRQYIPLMMPISSNGVPVPRGR